MIEYSTTVQTLAAGDLKARIRAIVKEHARITLPLSALEDSAPLYQAGMTSFASVQLMMALENEFALEFPDSMLRREVFESIDAIARAIKSVLQGER
jgi:acyl carrier protein